MVQQNQARRVLLNTFTNLVGKGVVAVSMLLTLPIYFQLLGAEACGIIGFYNTLVLTSSVFDLGIGTSVNRILAQAGVESNKQGRVGDLIYTLEWLYWVIGGLISLALCFSAHFIAQYWLTADKISLDAVETTIRLIALSLFFYWPYIFYSNGLMGLQKQGECNFILSTMTVVRCGGAICYIYYTESSLVGFFVWQVAISLMQTLWARRSLSRKLALSSHRKFNFKSLSGVKNFSLGAAGLSICAVILMQVDKIVLSRVLHLNDYGIYILINSLASGILFLGQPVMMAFFPVLSSAVSNRNRREIINRFMQGSYLAAVAVVPIVALFTLFPQEILSIWFGSKRFVADHEALTFTLLSLGYGLCVLTFLPYVLRLAYGWTRLNLIEYILAILVLVPILVITASTYRGVGAASFCLVQHISGCFVGMHFMFRKILRNEKTNWYVRGVLLPIALSFSIACWSKGMMYVWSIPFKAGAPVTYILVLFSLLLLYRKELSWKTLLKQGELS